jgi:hypothetical protein
MKQNRTITQISLRFALTTLVAFTSICLSDTANAAPRQSQRYYGVTPGWVDQLGGGWGGPYHQDLLPNGTLTGPLAPSANGG